MIILANEDTGQYDHKGFYRISIPGHGKQESVQQGDYDEWQNEYRDIKKFSVFPPSGETKKNHKKIPCTQYNP